MKRLYIHVSEMSSAPFTFDFENIYKKFNEMQEQLITLQREKEVDKLLIQELKTRANDAYDDCGEIETAIKEENEDLQKQIKVLQREKEENEAYINQLRNELVDLRDVKVEKDQLRDRLNVTLRWLRNAAEHLEFLEALNRMWNGEPQTTKKPLITEVSSRQIYEFLHSEEDSRWSAQPRLDFMVIEGLLEDNKNLQKKLGSTINHVDLCCSYAFCPHDDAIEKARKAQLEEANGEKKEEKKEQKEQTNSEQKEKCENNALDDAPPNDASDYGLNDDSLDILLNENMSNAEDTQQKEETKEIQPRPGTGDSSEGLQPIAKQNKSKPVKKTIVPLQVANRKPIPPKKAEPRQTESQKPDELRRTIADLKKRIEQLENANEEYRKLNETYIAKFLGLQLNKGCDVSGPVYYGFSILFSEYHATHLIRLDSGNHPYLSGIIYAIEDDLALALAKFKKMEIVQIPKKEKNVRFVGKSDYQLYTKYSKVDNEIRFVFAEKLFVAEMKLFANASRRYPTYAEALKKIIKCANAMLVSRMGDYEYRLDFSDEEENDQ